MRLSGDCAPDNAASPQMGNASIDFRSRSLLVVGLIRRDARIVGGEEDGPTRWIVGFGKSMEIEPPTQRLDEECASRETPNEHNSKRTA